MPLLANAKKALRSSAKKAVVNNRLRSRVKTMTDKVRKDRTESSIAGAFSSIDRAVKGRIIHKNKAARLKSQLSKLVGTAASTAVKTAKTQVAKAKTATKAKTKAKVKATSKAKTKKAK